MPHTQQKIWARAPQETSPSPPRQTLPRAPAATHTHTHTANPRKKTSNFTPPLEIYAIGGGLLATAINAPHLLYLSGGGLSHHAIVHGARFVLRIASLVQYSLVIVSNSVFNFTGLLWHSSGAVMRWFPFPLHAYKPSVRDNLQYFQLAYRIVSIIIPLFNVQLDVDVAD